MKIVALGFFICLLFGCEAKSPQSELDSKEVLTKPLNEISGMVADGNELWAITDKPKAVVYKLNPEGKVVQEVTIKNAKATDVEAVTKDDNYIYIGDIGDNEGDREERQVIKVSKSAIGTGKNPEVDGEVITFRFSDDVMVDKKKKNNYDCEAILSFGDSLYVFTKRRTDLQTELFSLPKTAGSYIARSIGTFDTKGLVTDASINKQNNEVALTGYNKGHKYPFILLFTNFLGNNFLSGNMQRIELADKPWDWQIESITYNDKGEIYFACEETKEVKSTLYAIKREKLNSLNKKK
jgi:hypothetical protein